MFNCVSTLEINGGTFVDIAHDAYFGQLQVGDVHVAAGRDVHINVFNAGGVHLPYQIVDATTQEANGYLGSSLVLRNAGGGLPLDSFACVDTWLQAMSHCLARASEKSFRTLRRHLNDIGSLSSFSRTLYEISDDSPIDRIVKRRVDMRLRRCARMLEDIHRRISSLPCWWLFAIKFAYGETFVEWLTNGREPDELQSIEGELTAEIRAFGQCVQSMQCLEEWPWGPQMWCSLTAKTSFSAGLGNFLRVSGPSWIRDVVVEEIIILEPIQGNPWSVPLVFVETIEDIHAFVRTGSRNTISNPYIEGRQYQLDESKTNAEVDERSLSGYLRHKTILEVTIRIRAPAATKQDRCPGCGRLPDILFEEGTWVRCVCQMQYIQGLITQEAERVPSPTPRDRKESDENIELQNNADRDASSRQAPSVSADPTVGKAAHGDVKDSTEGRLPKPSFALPAIAPPSAFRRLKIETVQDLTAVQVNIEALDDIPDNSFDIKSLNDKHDPASISIPDSHSMLVSVPPFAVSRKTRIGKGHISSVSRDAKLISFSSQ
ncbi:hypothetical protein BKA70DRAFT_1245496 [Coprinopsis sp. MPI-PUGE-AT-0042]|nr:hypothetical protein BKA70DRAFT_1245496 [Coprinopsis sp. MPI-PUGE-AT-0042]